MHGLRDIKCMKLKVFSAKVLSLGYLENPPELKKKHNGPKVELANGTGHQDNVLITKPSERFQDTRVILKKFVKFEKRRVKTLRQDALPER